jgi:glyoxylate carboligase
MAKAFYIARSGRPGPVLVDITKMRNLMNLSSVIKKIQILEVIIQNQL